MITSANPVLLAKELFRLALVVFFLQSLILFSPSKERGHQSRYLITTRGPTLGIFPIPTKIPVLD